MPTGQDGRRYLSEGAVAELSCKQTGDNLSADYGLGFQCGASGTASGSAASVGGSVPGFGHGGAVGTELWVNPEAGRVTVWMVHQDGGFGLGGEQLRPMFKALGAKLPRAAAAVAAL